MSAVNGNSDVQLNYAMLLRDGVGPSTDLDQAVKYAKQAAERQRLKDEFHYAYCTLDTLGIDTNLAEGAKFINPSPETGRLAWLPRASLSRPGHHEEHADKHQLRVTVGCYGQRER
jgi:TPR repeat protein